MGHEIQSSCKCFIFVNYRFFLTGLPKVDIRTVFNDLLPVDDPFVRFTLTIEILNPMTIAIMVKNKEGDIYNPSTLSKIWDLTRDIDLAPAGDHDQILSVATEKLRFASETSIGIETKPLMDDHPPRTPEIEDSNAEWLYHQMPTPFSYREMNRLV